MRRLLAVLAAAIVPATAAAAPATVDIRFDSFGPSQVDVLPGETVRWQNASERTHTVTGEGFDSGELAPGAAYERVFSEAGTVRYGCTLHPGMSGTVDVAAVLLDPLPLQAVPRGDPVAFSGRTADPTLPVRVEHADDGRWTTVATAAPAADGTWAITAPAEASGEYRAASAAGASRPRMLFVSDRRVRVHARRGTLSVSVTPPLPYGTVALQRDRRERFGWWTVRRARLDYVSEARFRLRGRTPVRVALLAADGWTTLAVSPAVAPRRRAPPAPPAPAGTS